MEKISHDIMMRFIKLLNLLLMAVPFGSSILLEYQKCFADPFCTESGLLLLGLFLILYSVFGRIYEAFAISRYRISEMIYSQALAALAADTIEYLILWLVIRRAPTILPLLSAYAAQLIIAVIWCTLSHRLYYRIFPPRKTAVIYDTRPGLDRLIHEYGLSKKYDVVLTLHVSDCEKDLDQLRNMDVVFLSGIHSKARNVILKYCMYNDIEVLVIPRIGDVIMSSAQPIHMFHLPMLEVRRYHATPEYLFLKRLMDIVLSLIALVVLGPLMLIVGLAIHFYDNGPIIYKQVRLTKDGKEFEIHKFRSMSVDAEQDGIARLSSGENDKRITPIGKYIRKIRFDELPQLFDILKGDLSIVGPRPERTEIAEKYTEEMPEFALRLQAKAGLTGYAQVYGKYNTSPYDKLQMDLMYIAHPSLIEDLKIILATVKILFMPESTEGVSENTAASAEK